MNLLLLHKWALRLLPLRVPSMAAAALSWLALAVLLIDASDTHALSVRLLLIFSLWALVLFAFVSLFKTPLPVVLPALRWQDRLLLRLQNWLYYLMAISFALLGLAVAGLSVKLGFLQE